MTFHSLRWSEFVITNRRARRMKRSMLAAAVGIHPSYVTLIERDGFVPVIEKVRRISQFFGKEHEGLVCAGFSPLEDARRFAESNSFAKTGIPHKDIWDTAKSHGLDKTLDAIKSAILLARATRNDPQSEAA